MISLADILGDQLQAEAIGFKHLAPEQTNALSSLYFEISGSGQRRIFTSLTRLLKLI